MKLDLCFITDSMFTSLQQRYSIITKFTVICGLWYCLLAYLYTRGIENCTSSLLYYSLSTELHYIIQIIVSIFINTFREFKLSSKFFILFATQLNEGITINSRTATTHNKQSKIGIFGIKEIQRVVLQTFSISITVVVTDQH